MDNIRIRQGATYEETFIDGDTTAETLQMTISLPDGEVMNTISTDFSMVDGRMVATLTGLITLPIDEYEYMYTVTYSDGFVLKLPEPEGCGDEPCALPKFIVCDANDGEAA